MCSFSKTYSIVFLPVCYLFTIYPRLNWLDFGIKIDGNLENDLNSSYIVLVTKLKLERCVIVASSVRKIF